MAEDAARASPSCPGGPGRVSSRLNSRSVGPALLAGQYEARLRSFADVCVARRWLLVVEAGRCSPYGIIGRFPRSKDMELNDLATIYPPGGTVIVTQILARSRAERQPSKARF
jgi:hypothetical protein